MRIRGFGGITDGFRCLIRTFKARAVILLYHRVSKLSSDPQLLSVTESHFEEHLEHLRRHFRPMGLRELKQALDLGRIPNRAVAITFDDGYADSLYNAKPLLERYDIPATVFVTSGYVEGNREFWWDELDRLVLQPKTLPAKLDLMVNGTPHRWELGEVSNYTEESYERCRGWNVEKDVQNLRQHVYLSLCQMLRPLPETERQRVLGQLRGWARTELVSRSTHRILSPVEVLQLAEGNLVQVGAHTVNHPVLSGLQVEMQRREVQWSKAYLEEILGGAVTTFSYPYGTRGDYTKETIAIVREAGFGCACSNFPGVVLKDTDRFQLPRLLVRDWDGAMFYRRITEWF